MSDEEIWKRGVDLSYVIDAYKNLNIGDHFFRPFFELLVGTDYVRKMIIEGKSAEEIKNRWKGDVEKFKEQRKPYLLYQLPAEKQTRQVSAWATANRPGMWWHLQ